MLTVALVFTVVNVATAIDWYEQALGFRASFRNEPYGPESVFYAVLRCGQVGIHLVRAAAMGSAPGEGACAFDVDNYGALVSACKSAGAAFYIEPDTPIPTGARSFGVLDPDGNKLLFIEEPAS